MQVGLGVGFEKLAGLRSELLPCEVGGGGGGLSVSFHATLDGVGGVERLAGWDSELLAWLDWGGGGGVSRESIG